jgi:hypothetical protein
MAEPALAATRLAGTDMAVFLIGDRAAVVRDVFGADPDRFQAIVDIPLIDGTQATGGPRLTFEGSTS